jgi:4-hydroxybenzoate-CoA ligase
MLEDLLLRRPYNAAADLVDANVARGLGRKLAFVDPERSLTYGQLQALTLRFASALKSLGMRQEDRLLLLLPDCVDYPIAFWGAIRAGIVAVPLNTFLASETYAYILADSRASAVVAVAPLAEKLLPALDRAPALRKVILVAADASDKGQFPRQEVSVRGSAGVRAGRAVHGAHALR